MTIIEEIQETKNLLKGTVKELNGSMKRHNQNWRMVLYHILLVLSIIGFLILIAAIIRLQLPQPIEPRCCWKCLPYHNTISTETIFWWTMVMKMFLTVVSSLMLVWWMKYLNKLISDCREAMKPWQKKVSDTYSFLVDMEMLLHKANIEKEKKKIEKDGHEPNPVEMELPTNKIKELVKKEMENVIKESIVEKATIEWTLSIKQENKE